MSTQASLHGLGIDVPCLDARMAPIRASSVDEGIGSKSALIAMRPSDTLLAGNKGEALITETTITGEGDVRGERRAGFHLIVMSPDAFSSEPLPAAGKVTIGRSTSCMVQIADVMASREHAALHIGAHGDDSTLMIEDAFSANGTCVRDALIRPGERVGIVPGEAVIIGSTVLMVLQDWAPRVLRRIWSHAYFEARVEDECTRAARSHGAFALARISFAGSASSMKVMAVMARHLTAPHIFATYGPKDYEILLLDTPADEVDKVLRDIVRDVQVEGIQAQCGIAWYPKDGRTGDGLLAAANALLNARSDSSRGSGGGVPNLTGMTRVRTLALRAAPSAINVLILGEMGVGKDVLARLIHQMSPRADKPFLALNCGAVPESLLESELFGHEKGAFTGASGAKQGLFEAANGGTVFLDEIGEMPLSMQVKLLRVLESREVRPVGGPLKGRPIDVRFISATNVDIEAAVKKGTFRGDLMYRLNTLSLSIPPLRERKEEIPELVATFLAQTSREIGRPEGLTMSGEAMACLVGYAWPGNIRELRNIIERAVVLCDGPEILLEHLPMEKLHPATNAFIAVRSPEARAGGANERQRIIDALEACGHNQTRAAEMLGISRRTLSSRLDLYGIQRPQKRTPPAGLPPSGDTEDISEPLPE